MSAKERRREGAGIPQPAARPAPGRVLRTLNPDERRDVAPFIEKWALAQQQFQERSAELERVLRLLEPRMRDPRVSFDPVTFTFYESVGDGSVGKQEAPRGSRAGSSANGARGDAASGAPGGSGREGE